MDTEVVEPSVPASGRAAGPGDDNGPGAPEATIDEVDRLLDEVEAALGRLDEGTYGTCAGCGEPIDDTRLSGRPTARACAACDPGGAVAVDRPEPADHRLGVLDDDLDVEDTVGRDGMADPSPAPSPWSVRAFPDA